MRWRKDEPFTAEHVARKLGWTRPFRWVIYRGIWNVKVIDSQNVPATGRVIVAANHTGVAD